VHVASECLSKLKQHAAHVDETLLGAQDSKNFCEKSGEYTSMSRYASIELSNLPAKLSIVTLGLLLGLAGCKSNSNQNAQNSQDPGTQPAATDNNPQDQGDPANANLAPVASTPTQYASSNTQPSSGGDQGNNDEGSSAQYSDANYNPTPDEYASEPPPPLPEYQQPPIPQEGYIWTPGYWNWGSQGYYWVPGAWVAPPYEGALWTPGYWGYHGGRYGFYHGYWGRYVGFYGGINYGFGYVGVGYQGGYWRGNQFAYNRSVNNIRDIHITNVYNRTVVINRTIENNRVAYNGGPHGIQARPTPAEVAAFRAPHAPPMRAQVALARSAESNREQFANVNHGRPAEVAAPKPIPADKGIRPAPVMAAPRAENRPSNATENRPENRPGAAPTGRPEARPENNRPQTPPNRPNAPANRPEPNRPEPNRPEANRPAPAANRPESRPSPETRPAPQTRPTPQQRPETQQHPATQQRPEPQQRPQEHPAPQARPENRPAPSHPAPEAKPAPHPAAKPEPAHPERKPAQPRPEDEKPKPQGK
jgi:hypothetical protein